MIYKKLDPDSQDTITSALDLFRTPPTSAAISNAAYREYLTLNPITSRPVSFLNNFIFILYYLVSL
jgi:hypothetical protein